MSKDIAIVICGTPTNKGGFKYKNIGSRPLPGNPSSYLDKFDPESMRQGYTYVIKQQDIEHISYSMLIVYKAIKPSDQNTNRGAFIAVGVVVPNEISVNESIVYHQIVIEVHAHMSAFIDKSTNAFIPSFTIENYNYTPRELSLHSAYLVDSLCKASSKNNRLFKRNGKLTYNDVAFSQQDSIELEDLYYFSDNSKELGKNNQLEQILRTQEKKINALESKLYDNERSLYATNNENQRLKKENSDLEVHKRLQEQNLHTIQNKLALLEDENKKLYEEQYREGLEKSSNSQNDLNADRNFYPSTNFSKDDSHPTHRSSGKQRPIFDTQKLEKVTNIVIYSVLPTIILIALIALLAKGSTEPPPTEPPSPHTPSAEENITRYPNVDTESCFYKKGDVNSLKGNVYSLDDINTSHFFVYGRVQELIDAKKLKIDPKEFKKAFKRLPTDQPRYPITWLSRLGKENLLVCRVGEKNPKKEKRKKGLLAIWDCSGKSPKDSVVGFVEEVSEDKSTYKIRTSIIGEEAEYTFPTNISSNKSETYGFKYGCYPKFYELKETK